MNFKEINPGIVKLVAMVQAVGFTTTDSGDGVTNVELDIQGALGFPHIFMVVDPDRMISESHRLLELLKPAACFDPTVDRMPSHPLGTIEASYSPVDKTAILTLSGLDDAYMFGPDKDLIGKRLEYQIRFCDAWLEEPPIRESSSSEEPYTDHTFYRRLRETLVRRLDDWNFALPPF